jgi:protoporphyrinogen oxidase
VKKKVAVLGAGPMGLGVAYQLARDGHHPVIFEADDRIGGMTASFDFSGLTIERFYHFHCISDHAFIKILEELGLTDKLHWVPTKMGYWYLNILQPWGNPIALLKFKGLGLIAKFRYGIHAFLATKRNNWKPLDKVDAVSWIKRWVGAEAYEVLWRRLFEYKFYEYTANISAAWIWSRIRRLGRSRYNLFNEKLGYLEGGSDTLLQALDFDIKRNGGQIRLSQPVKRVIIENGIAKGVETDEGTQEFDLVISTIPLPYVPKIMADLPPSILNQFISVKNIAVVCVIVKLKQSLTENFWLNTNDPDMDIPGIIEYSNLRPLENSIVYVPFYMPGDHPNYNEPDEYFLSKVKGYFKKINSMLEDADFLDMKASRYRFAQPIGTPGLLDGLPNPKLPIQNLWVADTSYYYPEDRGISESLDFGRKMARDAVND